MDFLTDPFLVDRKPLEAPVLVTGAGGCIGSWVLGILMRSGVPCIAFDISKDKLSIDHQGIEATLVFKNLGNGFTPWLTLASTKMDPSVKVDAPLRYGQELVNINTNGTTLTYSIGIDYALDKNKILSFVTSFTPLDVNRPVELSDRDSFWNFKIGYSLSF